MAYNDSGSFVSAENYVKGQSFKVASFLTTYMVWRAVKNINILSLFCKMVLVSQISCFQIPPYQGALFGVNCQVVPNLLRISLRVVELISLSSSLSADRYVEALSEIIICVSNFWLVNLCTKGL